VVGGGLVGLWFFGCGCGFGCVIFVWGVGWWGGGVFVLVFVFCFGWFGVCGVVGWFFFEVLGGGLRVWGGGFFFLGFVVFLGFGLGGVWVFFSRLVG